MRTRLDNLSWLARRRALADAPEAFARIPSEAADEARLAAPMRAPAEAAAFAARLVRPEAPLFATCLPRDRCELFLVQDAALDMDACASLRHARVGVAGASATLTEASVCVE